MCIRDRGNVGVLLVLQFHHLGDDRFHGGIVFDLSLIHIYPAIVCTHPDGHNSTGNIHVHIVIGSIRMREVERKPYMQKPRDWLEGMKHSSTAQTLSLIHI